MTQFEGLQKTVKALNTIPGIKAELFISPRMRPRVEIEPKKRGSKVVLGPAAAGLIAALLEDKQLGYLQVRHSFIAEEGVKTLSDAIRGNNTAIEINLCSMDDWVASHTGTELLNAAKQSKNPNLDSFRPCKGHFGEKNVERAAALISQIATRPQSPIDHARVRARIPLIETLARCRWMRDPVTLKQFASNLNHCLSRQQVSPDQPVPTPSFSELGEGGAPNPIAEKWLNDWEMPRAWVAGARTIGTAQGSEFSIAEMALTGGGVRRQ